MFFTSHAIDLWQSKHHTTFQKYFSAWESHFLNFLKKLRGFSLNPGGIKLKSRRFLTCFFNLIVVHRCEKMFKLVQKMRVRTLRHRGMQRTLNQTFTTCQSYSVIQNVTDKCFFGRFVSVDVPPPSARIIYMTLATKGGVILALKPCNIMRFFSPLPHFLKYFLIGLSYDSTFFSDVKN